jgi:hypothetical protein
MNSFDEQQIDRLISAPGDVSPTERRRIKALITSDYSAAMIAEFFRGFYSDFERLRERPAAVDRFVDRLFPPARVIHLQPCHSRSSDPGATTYILAAMSSDEPARFETLASYAASDENVLVRLVLDRETNRCRVYVLAADDQRRANTLVSFPELNIDVATDDGGRGEFRVEYAHRDRDWSASPILLRLPVGKWTCHHGASAVPDESEPMYSVNCRIDEHNLAIQVSSREVTSPAVLFALLDTDGERRVVPVHNGVGRAVINAIPEEAIVRIYN